MQDLGIYPLPNGSPFEGNLCLICPILIFFFIRFFPFPFRMEGENPCACPGGYAQGFLYLIKMWQLRTDKGKS